ncbi:MAG: M56 family metallopeptidase, partial [Planctomycetota bacterium]
MNMILEQINSTGKAFVEFALAGLVQSSVLIVILLLVDLALRRKVRAVFRYWLLMLVLAKLVLPTSLSSPVSLGYWFGDKLENVKIVRQTTAVNPQEAPQLIELEPIEVGISTPPVLSPPAEIIKPSVTTEMATEPTMPTRAVTLVTWQAVVFLVWLAVVGAMGLLLLQRAIFVRGLIARAREANSLMKDALEFCRKQMGVKRKVGLKVSANATSPAVCGIWCYVILLPRNLGRSLGSRDLRAVLLHELAHIKRGDLWVNFVQTVLQMIYFYNLLLWFANAVIRRVREQAVDEAVLVTVGEKAQWYPQTLVSVAKLAFKRPTLSLRLIGVVESKSALTSRIKRILNRPIPKTAKLGIFGLAALIIMAAILLPMAGSKPKIGEGPEREVTVTLGWTGEQVKIPALVVFPDWGRETRKFKRWKERIGGVRDFKTYDTDGYKYVLSVHGVIEEAGGSRRASIANVLRYNPGGVLEAGSSYFTHGVPGQWWTCDEDGQKNIRVFNRPRAKECKKEVRFYGPDGKKTKEWHISEFDVVYGEMIFEPDGRSRFSHYLKELIHSPYPEKFTATLPNSVTVELVGVCEHPSEGKQWWRPNGTLLEEAPYDEVYTTALPAKSDQQ